MDYTDRGQFFFHLWILSSSYTYFLANSGHRQTSSLHRFRSGSVLVSISELCSDHRLTTVYILILYTVFKHQASVVNTSNVLAQRIGRLLIIGLNRPHKSNTVDRATADELYGVIRNDFEKNDEIYGGVLYGEGKDFCTGLDLEELSESGTKCLTEQAECAPMGPTRMCLTKPLIAAITGRAIGGGLELALMCDLRIAEQDSMLGLHPRKYGIPMMDMGTVRLPALIGLSRALDLTLTGRHLSATEAFQFGLINQIAKPGTAVGLAVKLMDDLCRSYGRHALLADRKSMLNAAGLWSSEGRTLEWQRKEFTSAIEALRSDGFVGIKTFVKEKTEGIKR